eukprot:4601007-Pleurochrysis_carterae.AAC.1
MALPQQAVSAQGVRFHERALLQRLPRAQAHRRQPPLRRDEPVYGLSGELGRPALFSFCRSHSRPP